MNICFTAIFGQYDDLKEPQVISPGWEYVVFTDQDLKSNIWKVVRVDLLPEGAQRTARYYKLVYHNSLNCERSIWVDASFIINCNLDAFWLRYFKPPLSAPSNPFRDCVYLEGLACVKNKRDSSDIIDRQVRSYHGTVPPRNGMIASGILLRTNNNDVKNFCEAWWDEVKNNSVRDQIAWAKIDHQMPGVCQKFQFDYRYSDQMIFTTHLHKRKIKHPKSSNKDIRVYKHKRKMRRTGNKII